jgi:hypothetical protein
MKMRFEQNHQCFQGAFTFKFQAPALLRVISVTSVAGNDFGWWVVVGWL